MNNQPYRHKQMTFLYSPAHPHLWALLTPCNFKPLKGKIICTANDSVLYIHGIEKVAIELPNSSGKMKCILKETIYSPEMAFTLI